MQYDTARFFNVRHFITAIILSAVGSFFVHEASAAPVFARWINAENSHLRSLAYSEKDKQERFEKILESYESVREAQESGELDELLCVRKDAVLQSVLLQTGVADPKPAEPFFPLWGALITGQAPYGPHTYTVDEHILQVVAASDQFFGSGGDPVRRRRIALFHDIGKRGYEDLWGDHAVYSAHFAEAVMRYLGYDNQTIRQDTLIVKYHTALHFLICQNSFPPYFDLEEFVSFLDDKNIDMLLGLTLSDLAGKKGFPDEENAAPLRVPDEEKKRLGRPEDRGRGGGRRRNHRHP
ncbi:MAG: hypothetical protein WCG78_04085, partial [Candidatus Omnitrophota bacterium]